MECFGLIASSKYYCAYQALFRNLQIYTNNLLMPEKTESQNYNIVV